jgi:hypothetical protein
VSNSYVDRKVGLEVLCSKAGAGTFSSDGKDSIIQKVQSLPSSD